MIISGTLFISAMLGDGPSLTAICVGFLGLGIIGFCLSLLRWWASLPIVGFLCLWGMVLLGDLYAADLYTFYSQEPEFLYTATFAILTGVLLPIIGIVINVIRRINNIK
jgi:hypothetical protein